MICQNNELKQLHEELGLIRTDCDDKENNNDEEITVLD
jgi:hypothetical protein